MRFLRPGRIRPRWSGQDLQSCRQAPPRGELGGAEGRRGPPLMARPRADARATPASTHRHGGGFRPRSSRGRPPGSRLMVEERPARPSGSPTAGKFGPGATPQPARPEVWPTPRSAGAASAAEPGPFRAEPPWPRPLSPRGPRRRLRLEPPPRQKTTQPLGRPRPRPIPRPICGIHGPPYRYQERMPCPMNPACPRPARRRPRGDRPCRPRRPEYPRHGPGLLPEGPSPTRDRI